MKNIFSSLSLSWKIFKSDKLIILFSLIPIAIGIALYSWIGSLVFDDFYLWGKKYIELNVSSVGMFNFLKYFLVGILSIIFYFVVSWTFVLIVSVFASPFNDLISSRVEHAITGKTVEGSNESISKMVKNILKTVLNELKKISIIILISLISIIIGFFFPPASAIISAILLAASFIDYSWSRHDYPVQVCVKDLKKSFLPYLITGFGFMGLMTIPLINLISLPFGVIYFTVLHTKQVEGYSS